MAIYVYTDIINGNNLAVKEAISRDPSLLHSTWLNEPRGMSLLHKAAYYGNEEIVEFLLGKIDVNIIENPDI
jgi:hypothetical protein